jgi:hypothetical protein
MKKIILYLIKNRRNIARALYMAAAILEYMPARTRAIIQGQKQLRGWNLRRKRDVKTQTGDDLRLHAGPNYRVANVLSQKNTAEFGSDISKHRPGEEHPATDFATGAGMNLNGSTETGKL